MELVKKKKGNKETLMVGENPWICVYAFIINAARLKAVSV